MEYLFWTSIGGLVLLANHIREGGLKEDGILGTAFILTPRILLGGFLTNYLFNHQVYSYNTESIVVGGLLPIGVLLLSKPLKALNQKLEFSKSRKEVIAEEFSRNFDLRLTPKNSLKFN